MGEQAREPGEEGSTAPELTVRQLVADPLLGTLGNYGGLTQTVPLLPGSPAIDAGNNNPTLSVSNVPATEVAPSGSSRTAVVISLRG